jgi:hypothetical protein
MKYSNGDCYEGEFNFNQREGKGEYNFNNGSSYTGEWHNDLKHGKGVLLTVLG